MKGNVGQEEVVTMMMTTMTMTMTTMMILYHVAVKIPRVIMHRVVVEAVEAVEEVGVLNLIICRIVKEQLVVLMVTGYVRVPGKGMNVLVAMMTTMMTTMTMMTMMHVLRNVQLRVQDDDDDEGCGYCHFCSGLSYSFV